MDVSKKNITQFVYDPKHPPKMSKAAMKRLDAMGDDDIDYSDIPEFTDEFWKHAKILRPAPKKMVSLRIEEPVLKWFRAQGKGYQGYMNAVLRAFVESNKRP
jgi:uncharacterized protein (DUF4415 family)